MLSEFQALHPDPEANADITEVLVQAHQLNGHRRRPPTRLRFLIDSAVSALPALHLQSGFKSPPSGVERDDPHPEFLEVRGTSGTPPLPEPEPERELEPAPPFAAA